MRYGSAFSVENASSHWLAEADSYEEALLAARTLASNGEPLPLFVVNSKGRTVVRVEKTAYFFAGWPLDPVEA